MGLIILIIIGGILGWLTSIILRAESARNIAINALAGITGAVVAGILANHGPLLIGLTGVALILACLGAMAVIAVTNVVREAV